MSVYQPDQEIHVGEDMPFSANYDSCEESVPPVLSGTFQVTAVPKDGTGATITLSAPWVGTVVSWQFAASDTTGRVGEIFRVQLRNTSLTGKVRLWLQHDLKVVD